jgi:hypothetical protein
MEIFCMKMSDDCKEKQEQSCNKKLKKCGTLLNVQKKLERDLRKVARVEGCFSKNY